MFSINSMRERYARRKRFDHLNANVLAVRDLACLKKALGWIHDPVLEGDHLHAFQHLEDLNDRRLRDAEVLGAACCNGEPKILLEIGTAHGKTTALMARNATAAVIYTVNIPPEEIDESGSNSTFAPSVDEIGRYYRQAGFTNIRQILKNTKTWKPDFQPIDVAFIDGCHDADFVYNDTKNILEKCRPGSIILWHDFNPELAPVYHWIYEVCRGIERLYADKIIKGRILHLRDSWIGLYKVS